MLVVCLSSDAIAIMPSQSVTPSFTIAPKAPPSETKHINQERVDDDDDDYANAFDNPAPGTVTD